MWTVVSKICSKFHASNVFPVLEAGWPVRVNAGGGDDASVSQRPNTSQHTPRKPKIDPLLRTRGLTTPGPVSCETINARPFDWFPIGWLNLPPVAFPGCLRPWMYFPTWVPASRSRLKPGCRPAGKLSPLARAPPLDLSLSGWKESQNRTDRDPVVTQALPYPIS